MIELAHPEALLLWPAALAALWRFGRAPALRLACRTIAVSALVLALASPEVRWPGAGGELAVVVDVSRSMPPDTTSRTERLLMEIEDGRRSGDRVSLISFGARPVVVAAAGSDARPRRVAADVDADGSDLAAALELAATQLERPGGRVLVVSDGQANGADPLAAAQRLMARGHAVDTLWLGRGEAGLDVAVEALEAPASVAVAEPFRLVARLFATQDVRARVELSRDGAAVVSHEVDLVRGENMVTLDDRVDAPRPVTYTLAAGAPGDEVRENDRARVLVRVEAPPRVLLISRGKGGLATWLGKAGLPLEVRAPGPISLASLEGVGAVVLENVAADRLGDDSLGVLQRFVDDWGGGLLVTGGKESFGDGGYYKSPLDPLLPVSLELRDEQRGVGVALALVLDRSGSMQQTVAGGQTKMQLAAEGAASALELLSARDEAAVFAVDTEVHTIVGLRPVAAGMPLETVRAIASDGGGIYIDVALRHARAEITRSRLATRHIVLFTDVADSEQPGDYIDTLAELRKQNVTVSVIGLGSDADVDAQLLADIAKRGAGRLVFVRDAESLPRVFSQETIAVARSSFVRDPAPLAAGADRQLLGPAVGGQPLAVGGFNVTHPRPNASLALTTAGGRRRPILAFWPHGLGRVAAYTGEVDGQHTGAVRDWEGYAPLLEQVVRWTMPRQEPRRTQAAARSRRVGRRLEASVSFASTGVPVDGGGVMSVFAEDGREVVAGVPARWQEDLVLSASFVLPTPGMYFPVIKVGGASYRPPPLELPSSIEAQPGGAAAGRRLLASLSRLTGGGEVRHGEEALERLQRAAAPVALWRALLVGSVVALLVEVGLRRLGRGVLRRRVAAQVQSEPLGVRHGSELKAPAASSVIVEERVEAAVVSAPAPESSVIGALARAKKRAKDRQR